ncbi:hypothetical protein N2152v2_003155 [Parachlorella kessleri]
MPSWRTAAASGLVALTLYMLGDLWVFMFSARGSGPCLLDDEGSWSIGLFKGSSPLNLTPIENVQPLVRGPAAWPVANPVLTCASVTGTPSNFGDIGVAESQDGGGTWRYLGLALDEPWHLSYPFIFQHQGKMYMVPEGYGSGALRLYRASDFPLRWEFDRVLVDRPLIDTSLFQWEGRWWMFTSDVKRRHATKNGELEAYYADTPLGPWKPHAHNPLMNGDRQAGARMGGRVVLYQGSLLRFGQDCYETYGHKLVAYRVDQLTPTEFRQSIVPLEFGQSQQGQAAWNGARYHHLDAHQLPDGSWVAVMDGDYQPSGPISSRLRRAAVLLGTLWGAVLGLACAAWLHVRQGDQPQYPRGAHLLPTTGPAAAAAAAAAVGSSSPSKRHTAAWQSQRAWPRGLLELLQRSLGRLAVWIMLPHSKAGAGSVGGRGGSPGSLRSSRNSSPAARGHPNGRGSSGLGCIFCAAGSAAWGSWQSAWRRLGGDPSSKAARWAAAVALAVALVALAIAAVAALVWYYYMTLWWERPTAADAAVVEGQLSKFTLLTMTYAARMPTLKLFVQHYSKCPSVAEILIVWNSGPPPDPARNFPGATVPVRVRVEAANSLNNRFRPDPLLKTRAVLELDDDILMWCSDLERGFAAWRRHPGALVGYYPRQLTTQPPDYRGEKRVFRERAYNGILTGAAFMDAELAFGLYWAAGNAAGREVVDRLFNCEDILMNFVLAAHSRTNHSTSPASSSRDGHAAGSLDSMDTTSSRSPQPTVLYVRPRRRLDVSQLSGVGLSRNGGAHANKRRACLGEFGRLFGGNPLFTQRIRWSAGLQPPVCSVPGLGCVYT